MKQKAESTEKTTETDTSNAEGSQAVNASSIVKKEWFPWAIVLLLVIVVAVLAIGNRQPDPNVDSALKKR